MKYASIFGLCAIVGFASIAATGEPTKKPKSDSAKSAIRDYEQAVGKARELFEKETEKARQKLLVDLALAQDQATKSNALDEAVLIRDLRKDFETTKPSTKDEKIQIISAFYGASASWLDVTEKVRQATKGKAKWATVVKTKDWGDPAPGWDGTRTLLVRYSVGPKTMFKNAYEGREIGLP